MFKATSFRDVLAIKQPKNLQGQLRRIIQDGAWSSTDRIFAAMEQSDWLILVIGPMN